MTLKMLKGRIRFIFYNWRGQLTIMERPIPPQKFNFCKFFGVCEYAERGGVICIEINDHIRASACPEFSSWLHAQG